MSLGYSFWCSRCRKDHPGECPTAAVRAPVGGRVTDRGGYPSACLVCGGSLGDKVYVCPKDCVPWTDNLQAMLEAWRAGDRNFPRAPAPSTASPVPAPRPSPQLVVGSHWHMEERAALGVFWTPKCPPGGQPYVYELLSVDQVAGNALVQALVPNSNSWRATLDTFTAGGHKDVFGNYYRLVPVP